MTAWLLVIILLLLLLLYRVFKSRDSLHSAVLLHRFLLLFVDFPHFELVSHKFWLLFRIGNDFQFEKGIEEMLKCEVHAFDPRYDFFCFPVYCSNSVNGWHMCTVIDVCDA